MEVHSTLVKQLRSERNWTQQHLADVCGISLRTVQRIEKFGNASNESVMSLCAVFDIQKSDICTVPKVSTEQLHTVSLRGHWILVFSAMLIGSIGGATLMYWWMSH